MGKEIHFQFTPEQKSRLEFMAWEARHGVYDDDLRADTHPGNTRGNLRFWKSLKERVTKPFSIKDATLVAAGATVFGLVVLPNHPRLVLGAAVEIAAFAFLTSRVFRKS